MAHNPAPEESKNYDGAFQGGSVRAIWRLSRTGSSDAIRDLAAVRTSADAPVLSTDQNFLADLPDTLMDTLDVTAGTNARRSEGGAK